MVAEERRAPAALRAAFRAREQLFWVVMAAPAFDMDQALAHLARSDERLAAVIARARPFRLRPQPRHGPYEALLEAIVYQSISGKAAKVVMHRVKRLAGGCCPAPEQVRRMRATTLRRAGLSAAKCAAAKDLARATLSGLVPTLAEARRMSDQELVDRLVTIRGIGAWTVEMFLIFRLGRPDVWPVHDYGVRKGFALVYDWPRLPAARELSEQGERWRPYRTLAAWYLWRAVELAEAKR